MVVSKNSAVSLSLDHQFQTSLKSSIAEHSLESSAFFVAVSGGVDSCVLLHAMNEVAKELNIELHSIHFNHGLQSESDNWEKFVQDYAKQLDIDCQSKKAVFSIDKSIGLEASARKERYNWFVHLLSDFQNNNAKQAVLLTAHHSADQAETIISNILRGTGVKGLRGIASVKQLSDIIMLRPLLDFDKQDILNYAREHGLKWVEDPSNQNTYYKRNAIRHHVMPELEKIQANSVTQFAKLSHKMTDVENILSEVAAADLALTKLYDFSPFDQSFGLAFEGLRHLSIARQLNAIRYWLDFVGFPAESEMDLLKVLDWSLNGASSGAELRRGYRSYRYYRDVLYVMPSVQERLDNKDSTAYVAKWNDTANGLLVDIYQAELRQVDSKSLSQYELKVLQRADAKTILLGKSEKHINVKNCLQDAGVPPWRRDDVLFLSDKNGYFLEVVGGQKSGKFTLHSIVSKK